MLYEDADEALERAEQRAVDHHRAVVGVVGALVAQLEALGHRVVEHPADGRLGLGGHLDEVEVTLARVLEGVVPGDHADLVAVIPDQADLGNADALVDPGLVALRGAPIEPSRDRH